MNCEDVKELNYITPIENLPSIFERGILSHKLAKRIPHHSVAMEAIQDKGKVKVVQRGRPLHDYANLYFDARNPMLYKRLGQHRTVRTSYMGGQGVISFFCQYSENGTIIGSHMSMGNPMGSGLALEGDKNQHNLRGG